MQINVHVLGALVIIGAIVFLAFSAIQPTNYSTADVNFEVDGGRVIVDNTTGSPAQVEITSRTAFTLTTNIEDLATIRSTREQINNRTVQRYAGEFPTGKSELIVTRGSNINFALDTDGPLKITTYPQTANATRNTIIIAGAAILGALFYASNATGHAWLSMLGGKMSGVGRAGTQAGMSS